MTDIYIIRHAEAEGNLYRRIHGHYNSLVTDRGIAQIEALEKRFRDIPIDAVYASDLYRTQATARAVSVPRRLPVTTTPMLREINLGVWEDETWGDVGHRDAEQLALYSNDPARWSIPGGEAYGAVQKRMSSILTELSEKHDGQAIALFSHGSVIRSLQARLLGIPSERISELAHCENTGVTLVRVEAGVPRIAFQNDASHLPDALSLLKDQDWWRRKSGADSLNMRFAPMDLERDGARYQAYRRDAWISAHGSLRGYCDGYLKTARRHAGEHPRSVSEAYLGDTPVGVLELAVNRDAADRAGCIVFYYMRPDYRGKGLSVQLLGEAVSVFRPMSRDRLRLHVAEENERALRFYKKYGFLPVGETKGAVGRLIVLEKDIAMKAP